MFVEGSNRVCLACAHRRRKHWRLGCFQPVPRPEVSSACALNLFPLEIRLNRLNGYDFECWSLRHYGALWKTRHAAPYHVLGNGIAGNLAVSARTSRA